MKYLTRIRRQLELKQTQLGLHLQTIRAMVLEAKDLDDQDSKMVLQIFEDKLSDAHEYLAKSMEEHIDT